MIVLNRREDEAEARRQAEAALRAGHRIAVHVVSRECRDFVFLAIPTGPDGCRVIGTTHQRNRESATIVHALQVGFADVDQIFVERGNR